MKINELFEAKKTKSTITLAKVISYIQGKMNANLVKVGLEHFHNSNGKGFGLRYIIDGTTKCIRLNWNTSAEVGKPNVLQSIDIFLGKSKNPSFNLHTKGVNLLQVLPNVAISLQNPSVEKQFAFPSLMESLMEAKTHDYNTSEALEEFLKLMAQGEYFSRKSFTDMFHVANVGIYDIIDIEFNEYLNYKNGKFTLRPDTNLTLLKQSILAKAGLIMMTRGGSDEEYFPTEQEEELEKRSYKDTLEDLKDLLKATVKGASNALFITGPGGVSKTTTVEEMLKGTKYFDSSGTISTPGLYTLLYHHRNNEILLFDDSDSVFDNEDSLNILKKATDTKKVRTLSWFKKSNFTYDPDTEDPSDFEHDKNMAPNTFEFTSRIIFISNISFEKFDQALKTRGYVVNINPSKDELSDYMDNILMDIKIESGDLNKEEREEVLSVLKKTGHTEFNIRTLVRALNLRASGANNWKTLIKLYA
jgi:hypothetical protein